MMDDNTLTPRSSNNNNFQPVASQSGYDNDRPTPGISHKSCSPAKEMNMNNNSDMNDSNEMQQKNQLSSHINNNHNNTNSRNSKNNNKLTIIEDRQARRARSKKFRDMANPPQQVFLLLQLKIKIRFLDVLQCL